MQHANQSFLKLLCGKMFSLKYRIAWNFSGFKDSNGQISSSSSPSFTLKYWNCSIEMHFQTLPNNNASCKLHLRFPVNPLGFATVQNCSYYLLNETTGQHFKLVNLSLFSTDWCDLGLGHCMDLLVVLVVDLSDSTKNSKFWMEGETKALNRSLSNPFGHYSALLNGRQCRLNVNDDPNQCKSIFMDGLEQEEYVSTSLKIRNKRAGGSQRILQLAVRSYPTNFVCNYHEEITSVDLVSISTAFKKMSYSRIPKISAIIDSLNKKNDKQCQDNCELYTPMIKRNRKRKQRIQILGNSSTIPAISDSCPSKLAITDDNSCPQESTSPATVDVAVTADQLKLIYKCFIDKKFCDITIQVPDGDEIKAHKHMLFSGSTVWRTLLNDNDQLSIITVADLEREIIETLVVFIYIGSVPTPMKQTDQLLIAAEKYGVDGLKSWCEQKLIDTISIDSAVNLLVLAHRYNAKMLFDKVLKFVREHTSELKQRDEWKSAFFSYPELAFQLFNVLL